MHRPAKVVLIPLLLLFASGEASAHAMLDHAEPRVGSRIATAPTKITLWFTQNLEPAFSTITTTNAGGRRVDAGKVRVIRNQMSISLRPRGTGTYRVTWHAVSVDTHTTDGNFTFQVGR